MYERFYGLADRPFDLTPNPRYLLLTETHREALSNLEYGIDTRKGLTLLIGEAGTGKTTVLRRALACAGASLDTRRGGCVYLNNPTLTRDEFLEALARRFGLSADASASKTSLLDELEQMLRERCRQGAPSALIVDEAQSLPDEILEELRLLANIESDTEKLLPLVLAGQPELADRLNDSGLRQLKQRVALRCDLAPLDLRETAGYIATRVRLAGGDAGRLFTRDAVIAVYGASRGIPRTINVICDNALLAGFAADQRPVRAATVEEVCRDFDLPPPRPSWLSSHHDVLRRPDASSERPQPFADGERLTAATAWRGRR